MKIYLTTNDLQVLDQPGSTVPPHTSLATMWNMLGTHACRLFGQQGKHWRMVQDETLIGFHVRSTALSGIEGETLHIA